VPQRVIVLWNVLCVKSNFADNRARPYTVQRLLAGRPGPVMRIRFQRHPELSPKAYKCFRISLSFEHSENYFYVFLPLSLESKWRKVQENHNGLRLLDKYDYTIQYLSISSIVGPRDFDDFQGRRVNVLCFAAREERI
jgi:hypothetical protein